MKRTTMLLIAVPAIAATAWGGVALSRTYECRGLEESYLNSAASLKGNVIISSAVRDLGGTDELKAQREQDLVDIERNLQRVYDQCGMQAGETAARKGTDLLF